MQKTKQRQRQPVKRPARKPARGVEAAGGAGAVKGMTGRDFDALPDGEKERIYHEIDRMTPEEWDAQTRPPNAAERAVLKQVQAKLGRPRTGQGVQTIALTVEKGLLKRADAYAAALGISRAQLVARGLKSVLPATCL
jgi:hypothetical protein